MKKQGLGLIFAGTLVAMTPLAVSAVDYQLQPIQIDPNIDLTLNEDVVKQMDVSVPHTFTAHTPAKAAEVNANFTALKNKVNANKVAGIDWAVIDKVNIDVRSDQIIVGNVEITAPASGYVVVRFDGSATASTGDRLILAASDDNIWHPNSGAVSFEGDGNLHPFSHTRVYPVTQGTHVFNAIVHNYVNKNGTGKASIHATLTATYYYTRY